MLVYEIGKLSFAILYLFLEVFLMAYKSFKFNLLDALQCKSGTEGYQMKFITKDNKYFVKVQCNLGGYLMDDWKVEILASRLCEHLSIPHIEQKPCRVLVSNGTASREFMGVYSYNLGSAGYSTISFESYLTSINVQYSTNNDWFVRCNTLTKIERLADLISRLSDINRAKVIDYLVFCAIVDILVYNNDRHTGNFHLCLSKTGVSLAPLHDFGMGLFENSQDFRLYKTWQECNRYCYRVPYDEDAFTLLELLDARYEVKAYLRRFPKPRLDKKLFPSDKAFKYFNCICKEIW